MPGIRWSLSIQAAWWRALGKIGTWVHDLPVPRPGLPQFTRRFTRGDGVVDLHFYVRDDHDNRMEGERFPVIVNFHGGGFTLGTATDDGRWGKSYLAVLFSLFPLFFLFLSFLPRHVVWFGAYRWTGAR